MQGWILTDVITLTFVGKVDFEYMFCIIGNIDKYAFLFFLSWIKLPISCISDLANKSSVPVSCFPHMVPVCDVNILPCQLVSGTYLSRLIPFPYHILIGHLSIHKGRCGSMCMLEVILLLFEFVSWLSHSCFTTGTIFQAICSLCISLVRVSLLKMNAPFHAYSSIKEHSVLIYIYRQACWGGRRELCSVDVLHFDWCWGKLDFMVGPSNILRVAWRLWCCFWPFHH